MPSARQQARPQRRRCRRRENREARLCVGSLPGRRGGDCRPRRARGGHHREGRHRAASSDRRGPREGFVRAGRARRGQRRRVRQEDDGRARADRPALSTGTTIETSACTKARLWAAWRGPNELVEDFLRDPTGTKARSNARYEKVASRGDVPTTSAACSQPCTRRTETTRTRRWSI